MNSAPQAHGPSPDSDAESKEYLRKIERLANFFISGKFGSSADLWNFQIELMELQRKIQDSIAAEKERIRRSKVKSDRLQNLKYARYSARRLGDSFAWILLGGDSKVINPLGENSPVPIGKEGHGSRGLVAVSSHLANEGWGFPVIHDITDLLRIGDVTFLQPGSGEGVRTVELKTRHLGDDNDIGGSSHYEVSVNFMAHKDDPVIELSADIEKRSSDERIGATADETPKPPRRDDRRIARQAKRMARALTRQRAQDGEVSTIDGEDFITAVISPSPLSHWKDLRRAIREARANGYSSMLVDKAFLYAAFYDASGLEEGSFQNSQFIEDVTSSGLVRSRVNERNSLQIYSIPEGETRRPQQYLPYFLYSIPKRAVFDLLRGRLQIIVVANAGHIADALEDAGFDVTIPKDSESPIHSIEISAQVEHEGVGYRFRTDTVGHRVLDCVYGVKGIDYLLKAAQKMKETIPPLIKDKNAGGE
ncbi:hypothetical protein [Streptomyces rubiginosohelvolus]|uniref:hypothetical protein n=1 Tax=Streptomyces rubiginosohelvolus TaxID=67362 RepID=UPI0037F29FF1